MCFTEDKVEDIIRPVVTWRLWDSPLKASRYIFTGRETFRSLAEGPDRLGGGAKGNLEKLCNLYWIYSCCVYRCVVLLWWGSQSSKFCVDVEVMPESPTQAPRLIRLHSARFSFSCCVPPLATFVSPQTMAGSTNDSWSYFQLWNVFASLLLGDISPALMNTCTSNTLRNKSTSPSEFYLLPLIKSVVVIARGL